MVQSSNGSTEESESEVSTDNLMILGALASNIAHDFNNLIMTIQGSAQMALREQQNPAKIEKGLENILLATRHSRELIDQISALNRKQELKKVPINLNRAIQDCKTLVEVSLPQSIEFIYENPKEQINVLGNDSQLQQLLMNLSTNAIHAMREQGGSLEIGLQTNQEEQLAVLTIRDSGPGIAQEAIDKIFDPFFTTKSIGLGTGLGLAVVQNVVQQLDGTISASSEKGKGTQFTISIPRTDQEPQEENMVAAAIKPSHEKKAILLVDDEPFMRGLGIDMLHSLGYRVCVANNGKEALELVQKSPEYFDVILSDSKMPEMTGPQLAEALNELNPDLPFILITAFSDSETEDRLKSIGVNHIVKKPFLIENLNKALNNVLEKRS